MTSTAHDHHAGGPGWEHIGRVAEHFARRVARDARRFATHIEQHAGEFARDVARDWSAAWQDLDHERRGPTADVRGMFDDVRKILADVIDGVDELIGGLFAGSPGGTWTRVVSNRDASCVGCGAAIAAGAEAHVRRALAGTEFRCLACGPA